MKKFYLLLAAALTFGAAVAQEPGLTAKIISPYPNNVITLGEGTTSATKNYIEIHVQHIGYTLMSYYLGFQASDNITITGALAGEDAKVYNEDLEETVTATPSTGGGDGHAGNKNYNVAGVFLSGDAFTATSTLAEETSYVMRLRYTVSDDFDFGTITCIGNGTKEMGNSSYLTSDGEEYTALPGVDQDYAMTEPTVWTIKAYGYTAIEDVNANKTVVSKRYFNIAGVETSEATQGVNIVVTTYTDGTTNTAKVLK